MNFKHLFTFLVSLVFISCTNDLFVQDSIELNMQNESEVISLEDALHTLDAELTALYGDTKSSNFIIDKGKIQIVRK